MPVCRLIYASYPNLAFGSSREMAADLLPRSALNNARDGITGMLVTDEEFFLQVLEGERQPVSDTFLRIAQDHRHGSVAILSVSDAENRLFPNWSLTALDSSQTRSRLLRKHRKSPSFDPHHLNAVEALSLMAEIGRLFRARHVGDSKAVVYIP